MMLQSESFSIVILSLEAMLFRLSSKGTMCCESSSDLRILVEFCGSIRDQLLRAVFSNQYSLCPDAFLVIEFDKMGES